MKNKRLGRVKFVLIPTICIVILSTGLIGAEANIKQNLELVPVSIMSYNPKSGWYPGMSNDSEESYDDITLSIQNRTDNKIKIKKIYIKQSGDLNNLKNYITDYAILDIRNDGKSISKIELKGLLDSSKEIDLSKENIELLSGQQKDLDVIVNINEEMDNDAQEKELRLSISAGYEEIKSLIPLEPEDPTEKPEDPIEKPESDKDKLPQTGRIINSTTLGLLGLGSIVIGMLLNKKGIQYKGGKSNE